MRGGARRQPARRRRSGSLALARISGFARLAPGLGTPSVGGVPRAPYLRRWAFFSSLRSAAARDEDDLAAVAYEERDHPARHAHDERAEHRRPEIGRASWRERV